MTKKRPVIVISPRRRRGPLLCTIVPLSTTAPVPRENYHLLIKLDPPLPPPYNKHFAWVKADMLYTVGAQRLTCPYFGHDESGKRQYHNAVLSDEDLQSVIRCVSLSLGIGS